MAELELASSELKITEIYASVQGESIYNGWPCTFIRLSGCPLRCRWCDTAYSFQGGQQMSLSEILAQVKRLGVKMVELTGGEPLAQSESFALMQALVDEGYRVLIETGGSESVYEIPSAVHIIMDLKCPDSGMSEKNYWQNLEYLKSSDEIKFVIASRKDYEWARDQCQSKELALRFKCSFSPAFAQLPAKELVEWMLEDRLDVRLNLQTHKYIWSPRAKGV